MEALSSGLLVLGALAVMWLGFTLAGWHNIRSVWNKPVTWSDYRRFRKSVISGDTEGIKTIARKYGYVLGLAFLMVLPVFALDVPQKPANPGTLPEPGNVKEVAPALPDYTKDPFHLLRKETTRVDGRDEWGVVAVMMYTTNQVAGPGDQAVYVAVDENGIKRLADWFVFNADLSYSQCRYRFEGGAWVFYRQIR